MGDGVVTPAMQSALVITTKWRRHLLRRHLLLRSFLPCGPAFGHLLVLLCLAGGLGVKPACCEAAGPTKKNSLLDSLSLESLD